MGNAPEIDSASPMQFVINAAAGRSDAQTKRDAIAAALDRAGRTGELLFAQPAELPRVAQQAAQKALAAHAAVVAVGGDGTINTVAQAAHAQGCAMGVIAQGTFNYFARTHGIAADPAQAAQLLFDGAVQPVQVGSINGHVFLVNASLGLYPQLLEDREAYKARFGRSRLVAISAACVTLLRAHRQLLLHIDLGSAARDVRTPTLFVGNNRLQLEQVGVPVGLCPVRGFDNGRVAAVMLRPIGTLAMIGLMLRGAMGALGEADSIESFEFDHMLIKPRVPYAAGKVKVAMDGEVKWMRWPIEFAVPSKPLYLIKPRTQTAPLEPAQAAA
jgi:diacylglycerol kinase family enzyme